MGVMLCDRNGCDGQHARTIWLGGGGTNDDTRYLCYDCLSELQDIIDALPSTMTKGEVVERIKKFFASEKVCDGANEEVNPASFLRESFR